MKQLIVVMILFLNFLVPVCLTGMPENVRVTGLCPADSMMQILKMRRQIESSLTLLENRNGIIPLKYLDTLKIASLSIGHANLTPFQKMLTLYSGIDHFNVPEDCSGVSIHDLQKKLGNYNLVITGMHTATDSMTKIDSLWDYLTSRQTSVIVCFQEPDVKILSNSIKKKPAVFIMGFRDDTITQELAAQLVFGGIGAEGRLTSDIGNMYATGEGISIDQPVRLKYTIAEETGISTSRMTSRIDSVVNQALVRKAFPGCNILIAKDGKVIFHKAYGFHTYDSLVMTNKNDMYDLASVTKVTSALPALMKLYDQGKLDLDAYYSTYWPDWKNGLFHRSNKEDITVRELLAHQAGLVPYIGFYKESMKDGSVSSRWYHAEADEKYNLAVAPGLFLRNTFKKKVYKTIRLSAIKDRGSYVYSDLFFVMAPEGITKISGMNYESFLDSVFYKPLGAASFTYNPWQKFSVDGIVPTENDTYYRKRQLQGWVHDESAAVLGGISGNAGLFANANDLAKLLQLYLQQGTYGGRQFLKASTLQEFTRIQFPENNNRRGAGFDKPLINNARLSILDAYPAPAVSPESFGHSGFTGTFFWVDPVHRIVYIFLSNRVYPSRSNNLLSELNIRIKIQQILYDEMTIQHP